MSKQNWMSGAISGAASAIALLLVCGSPAQAQSTSGGGTVQAPGAPSGGGGTTPAPGAQSDAGTVQAPGAPAPQANPIAPSGPYRSKLPLASQDQFTNAEQQAPNSAPTGASGVSNGDAVKQQEQPYAYGASTAPYTTARVAVSVLGNSSTAANTPVTSYPNRATGKLYFKEGTQTFVCTASLIKKGVLITAAHCVFNYGKKTAGWYTNFTWCPANTSSAGGVYGCYTGISPRILSTYYNGNDVCTQTGVVCNDDMATILVSPKNRIYAGSVVGWYYYGWNGYSYRASSFLGNVTTVQVTQLGYPVAFDSGYQMERTDAVGWYFASGNLKNTQIGSAQTGGSSGGPWLANFGTVPSVSSSASLGSYTTQTIIGVTSYGSTTVGFNRQGASYFGQNSQYSGTYGVYGAGNIGLLVRDTCVGNPAYC
jgi:V8-like Glu-specific endopeptidase